MKKSTHHTRIPCVGRTLRRGLALLILPGLASPAVAKCYLDGNGSNSWSDSIAFNDADYVRDTAIGHSTTRYVRPGQTWPQLLCDWSNYLMRTTATITGGELVPGYANVYKTGVDGIGVQFFAVAYGYENTREAPFFTEAPSSGANQPISAAARLIVTGPIKGGRITTLPTLHVQYKQGPYDAQIYTITVKGPITITTKSCKVQNPDFNVPMETAFMSSRITPGDTFEPKGFEIQLADCPADVKVYATLTDAETPANRSDVLSLSMNSSARGIGLRITHDGKAVKFGPDSSSPHTPNQFLITDAPTPFFTVPMEVSYIRLDAPFESGSVYGSVILNMSYQ